MNLLDVLLTSSRIWLFSLLGIAVAFCLWCYMPEDSDRLILCCWAITIGYTLGWLLSYFPVRKPDSSQTKAK